MPSAVGVTRGIQLWVNLPLRLKSLAPDYQQVNADAVPERKVNNGVVRVLAGEGSPLSLNTPVIYLDAQLDADGEFEQVIPSGFRGIVYVVDGQCEINDSIVVVNNVGNVIRSNNSPWLKCVD